MSVLGVWLAVGDTSFASKVTLDDLSKEVTKIQGFFKGTGWKTGLAVATIIGMVMAVAKGSIALAGLIIALGMAANMWIAHLVK